MKLAIVTERIEAWRGGAEASTMEFAHLLAARGHAVHVITSDRSPSPPDLTIHTLSVAAPFRPLRTAAFIRKAGAFVRDSDFDVVHAIAPLPEADVYQPRGGSIRETIDRNIALRGTPGTRLLKRVAAALSVKYRSLLSLEQRICRPDGPVIAAVSQYVARQFAEHHGLTPPRVRVIFNGVDWERSQSTQRQADREQLRRQYGIAPDSLMLLCVAHNFRLKGVPRLIDAVARLQSNGITNVTAVIVGRDNPVPARRQALACHVADRILFAGPSPRVGAFLNACDVCVHPTYYDPCSRIVLEALARGVPTITTRQNGAAEVIAEGVSGYVIDTPEDIAAMADRILRLADPALRDRMGRAAAELAPRLRMSRHVDEMAALYSELAEFGRRTR